jgi:hypothetical protein
MHTRKPAWWMLYGLLALLGAAFALVDWLVPAAGARQTIDLAVVSIVFLLMALWVQLNRAAILEQQWLGFPRG